MTKTRITVAYQVFDRQDRIQIKEKNFDGSEAMSRWVEKQEQDNPRWYRTLAICEEATGAKKGAEQ